MAVGGSPSRGRNRKSEMRLAVNLAPGQENDEKEMKKKTANGLLRAVVTLACAGRLVGDRIHID